MAETEAVKAAAAAAARPKAVLNDNGSWSITQPEVAEQDSKKVCVCSCDVEGALGTAGSCHFSHDQLRCKKQRNGFGS